jgi:GT2 family glycosyltransferase
MKLSIIIVSYNTCKVLLECIDSIYQSEISFDYEIICVDNNSGDDTIVKLKENYPKVIIIRNDVNNYFAKANNQGARIAKGEFLSLLNSDTIVYDRNIEKLVQYMDTLPQKIICLGPKILNKDHSIQSMGFPNPSIKERIGMCLHLYKFIPPYISDHFLTFGMPYNSTKIRRIGWVSGSCMLIRRKEYLSVGGLNENLIFYGEEPEFGYRTSQLGFVTLFYPDSEIIHLGGKSTPPKIPEEERMDRYSALQKYTVGYTKAIIMSYIVIMINYIKLIFLPKKKYYSEAIKYEKRVVAFLKVKKYEKNSH